MISSGSVGMPVQAVAAAAMALARDVSVLKKPVPSPRAASTSRPASSTTVTLMGEFRALAFPCAARRAFSAISSVISIMNSSGMVKASARHATT